MAELSFVFKHQSPFIQDLMRLDSIDYMTSQTLAYKTGFSTHSRDQSVFAVNDLFKALLDVIKETKELSDDIKRAFDDGADSYVLSLGAYEKAKYVLNGGIVDTARRISYTSALPLDGDRGIQYAFWLKVNDAMALEKDPEGKRILQYWIKNSGPIICALANVA